MHCFSVAMLSLHAVTYLPVIVAATPSVPRLTDGHIACVEPIHAGGRVYNISSTHQRDSWYGTTAGDDLLSVEIDLDAAKTGSANMKVMSGGSWWEIVDLFKPNFYFGAIPRGVDGTALTMGPSTGDFAILGRTHKTDVGAQSSKVESMWSVGALSHAYTVSYVQSAIWRYDPTTKRLTPHWVNADQSTPKLHVFYDTKRNAFGITGNISAYQERHYPVRECILTFSEF